MFDQIKCWFGRHLRRYYTDGPWRVRECTRCGRRWRRERYDMTLVWVRIR